MPGPAVHTIISEHLPDAFASASFNGSQQVANAMRQNRNHRRAMTYGAMGPDPLFFNLDDLSFMPQGTARALISAWNFIGRLRTRLHDVTQPLIQARRRLANAANAQSQTLSRNSPIYRKVRDTLVRLREVSRVFGAVKKGFVKKFVLNNTDPFGLYVSSYQRCENDHRKWWWFDTLHTRQTGDFVTWLFDIARGQKSGANGSVRNRSLLLSYAAGYLSHIAADVVGHAYVNTIVGGPYRLNQAQRHTTQEKLMDVWAYSHYYDNGFLQRLNTNVPGRFYMNENVLNSGLHKNQQFLRGNLQPHQFQINNNRLFQRQKPSQPINSALELPAEIAENFAHAATELYNSGPNAGEYGPLTPEEVNLSYRLWYVVLRNSTMTRNIVDPKNLPGGNQPITQALQNQWQNLKNWVKNNVSVSNPFQQGSLSQCGGNAKNFGQRLINCLKSAASSLSNFLTNLAKSIVNLVQIVAAIVKFVTAKLLTLPLDFLNFVIERLYRYLHDAYRRLLLLITALGFGYCYQDQLKQPQIHHMTDPTQQDHFNNTVAGRIVKPGQADSGYPRIGPQLGQNWNKKAQNVMQGLKNEAHLVIPTRSITQGDGIEHPKTIPGPDAYASSDPSAFITDPQNKLSFDPNLVPTPPKRDPRFRGTGTETTDPSAATGTPSRSDYRPGGRYAQAVLGDAVQLTVELAKYYFDPQKSDFHGVPNLNMSGDRGIGYPNWANAKTPPCTNISRSRHAWKYGNSISGNQIQWLNGGTPMTVSNPKQNPLDPVFEPDPTSRY